MSTDNLNVQRKASAYGQMPRQLTCELSPDVMAHCCNPPIELVLHFTLLLLEPKPELCGERGVRCGQLKLREQLLPEASMPAARDLSDLADTNRLISVVVVGPAMFCRLPSRGSSK